VEGQEERHLNLLVKLEDKSRKGGDVTHPKHFERFKCESKNENNEK
jgi:hypothetical protein